MIGEWTSEGIKLNKTLEMMPFTYGKPHDSICSYDCVPGQRRVLGVSLSPRTSIWIKLLLDVWGIRKSNLYIFRF